MHSNLQFSLDLCSEMRALLPIHDVLVFMYKHHMPYMFATQTTIRVNVHTYQGGGWTGEGGGWKHCVLL